MTASNPLGHVERTATGWLLRFERRLRHSPEQVWRALTETEHLRHWLPVDIVGERRAGAALELPFWPDVVERYGIETPTLPGEIRVWDPPRTFEWTWDADVIRFELAPDGDDTLLVLTTWAAPEPHATRVGAGYHTCLDNLASVLATGTAPRLVDADTAALEARYRAVVPD